MPPVSHPLSGTNKHRMVASFLCAPLKYCQLMYMLQHQSVMKCERDDYRGTRGVVVWIRLPPGTSLQTLVPVHKQCIDRDSCQAERSKYVGKTSNSRLMEPPRNEPTPVVEYILAPTFAPKVPALLLLPVVSNVVRLLLTGVTLSKTPSSFSSSSCTSKPFSVSLYTSLSSNLCN